MPLFPPPPAGVLGTSFVGAGALFVVALFTPVDPSPFLRFFGAALALDLFVTLAGEFATRHASEGAAAAAHAMTHGKYKNQFWWGAIGAGHVVPLGIVLLSQTAAAVVAATVLATVGLYLYEHAFVMAPQEVPNS